MMNVLDAQQYQLHIVVDFLDIECIVSRLVPKFGVATEMISNADSD